MNNNINNNDNYKNSKTIKKSSEDFVCHNLKSNENLDNKLTNSKLCSSNLLSKRHSVDSLNGIFNYLYKNPDKTMLPEIS